MKRLTLVFFIALMFISMETLAGGKIKKGCPDAELLGVGIFNNFCWDCIFPMRISGVDIKPPKGEGSVRKPDGAYHRWTCSCPDPLGIPEFGIPWGAWLPNFIIETVQKPYCSPALGGTMLSNKTRLTTGGDIENTRVMKDRAVSDSAFLHFHTFSFPILAMLELFMEASCNPDGYVDMDLQYISEPDPLWSDGLLSAYLNPEVMLYANPAASAACVADCTAVSASGRTIEKMHWCAGCWGNVYPFTGHANHNGSRVKHTSLIAVKSLAAQHRRMLAYKTIGIEASCSGGYRHPTLVKEQYRFGMFFPVPQASSNHLIGRSTSLWGEHRNKASVGSHHVYTGYRYQDCCLR